jgi:hypothetical protein
MFRSRGTTIQHLLARRTPTRAIGAGSSWIAQDRFRCLCAYTEQEKITDFGLKTSEF